MIEVAWRKNWSNILALPWPKRQAGQALALPRFRGYLKGLNDCRVFFVTSVNNVPWFIFQQRNNHLDLFLDFYNEQTQF